MNAAGSSELLLMRKNIYLYTYIYDCPSCPLFCHLACTSEGLSPYVWVGGVFGLTEDAAHFKVLRKIHQSSLENKSCILTCSFQWK